MEITSNLTISESKDSGKREEFRGRFIHTTVKRVRSVGFWANFKTVGNTRECECAREKTINLETFVRLFADYEE